MIDLSHNLAHVLARRGDDFDWTAVIPFAVVLVLWIIGAASGGAEKVRARQAQKAAERARRAAQEQASRAQRQPQRAVQAMRPRPQPPQRRVVAPPPKKQTRRRRRGNEPAPVQAPAYDELDVASAPLAPAAPAPSVARAAAPPGLDAATLARWLTPQVMRQQFILTEVFDPPPGLGGGRENGPAGRS